jgi:enterochelin esterase-like enzyme
MEDFDIPGFGTYLERSPRGQMVTTEEEIDAIDAMKLVLDVPKDELPDNYIDCGTEDFLFERFQAFTALMRDNEITHTARLCPGGHTHEYWRENVRFSMAHQYQVLTKALASE